MNAKQKPERSTALLSTALHSRPRQRPRRAFTLVEMLVVVAIIGILASMMLGALFMATERARRERTRTLVNKLHNQVMLRWDEFETLRVPLQLKAVPPLPTPDEIGIDQVIFRYEIMRMQLPDLYYDLNLQGYPSQAGGWQTELEPISFANTDLPGASIRPPNFIPAVTRSYQERVITIAEQKHGANRNTPSTIADKVEVMLRQNQSAEMLYLVLTTQYGDEDSSGVHFADKDQGDTDNDGMLEFIDAWGNPIGFIRSPAGYANFNTVDAVNTTLPAEWGYVTDLIGTMPDDIPDVTGNAATLLPDDASDRWLDDPDPYDPRQARLMDPALAPSGDPLFTGTFPTNVRYGYRLVPLIMSPGPDGEYGVEFDRTLPGSATDDERDELRKRYTDPFMFWESGSIPGAFRRRGTPVLVNVTTGQYDDPSGEWVHHDNITNHLTEAAE